MEQKELNLDEILKQLSAPQTQAPEGISRALGGSPVYYGNGCKFEFEEQ